MASKYSDTSFTRTNFTLLAVLKRFVFLFLSMAQQRPMGQGLLVIEASRSHSDTPHSVGLLWASDQPDAETST
jgi:hypothetical protein